jgi:hypothetical protein
MNRRGFLGTLGAALGISVTALPAVAAPGQFVWDGPLRFDYGHQVAMCLTLPDGRRHAARTAHTSESVPHLKRVLLDWAVQQYGVKV